MHQPLVSIIIDNFNYARFLGRSIDGALGQTYPNCEVIVVDDVSTDGSQEIIRGYGSRVIPVLKETNGGHASAFNAGFRVSRGEIVFFVDSDDYLYPKAVERVIASWRPAVAKAQFRLHLTDADGRQTDIFPPPEVKFDAGDVVPLLLRRGRYETSVTSGNAFARSALDRIMPIPEQRFRQGADGYLMTLAPLFGPVVSIDEPLGAYVQHGSNHSGFSQQILQRLHWRLQHDASRYEELQKKALELGLKMEPDPGFYDAWHLENRLGSLCLDPQTHPRRERSRLQLALRGTWALRGANLPWRRRAVLTAWFLSTGLLPRPLARHLVNWRLDGKLRPRLVQRVLSQLRAITK